MKPAKAKRKKPSNGLKKQNGATIAPNSPDSIVNNTPVTAEQRRFFVFSTAMANRAGHAVSKGLHASISEYHAAQKWETPYLTNKIHCRPFNCKIEEKNVDNIMLTTENEKPPDDTKLAIKKEEQVDSKVLSTIGVSNGLMADSIPARIPFNEASVEDVKTTKPLAVDSWQKEQVIKSAQRMMHTVDPHPGDEIRAAQQQHQQHQQKLVDESNKTNPLHPRFHLFNTNASPSDKNRKSTTPPKDFPQHSKTLTPPKHAQPTPLRSEFSPRHALPNEHQQHFAKNPMLLQDSEQNQHMKNQQQQQQHHHHQQLNDNQINGKRDASFNKNPRLKSRSFDDHVTGRQTNNMKNSPPPQLVSTRPSIPSKNDNAEEITNNTRVSTVPVVTPNKTTYPADITNVKEQLRYQSPKNFSLDKLINSPTTTSSIREGDVNVRPTVINTPSDRSTTAISSIDIAEKHLKEARFAHRKSPPILPRDARASAFLPPRDSASSRLLAFKSPHFESLRPSDNSLYHPASRPHPSFKLHPSLSTASALSPKRTSHYAHPQEAIENIIDFSRKSSAAIGGGGPPSKLPVRPSVSRPNGYADSKAFSENYKPHISAFSTAHHNDRPSNINVPSPELYKRAEKIHNPFSVEHLTQSHNRTNDDNSDNENIRRYAQPPPRPLPHHPRAFHDRGLPPSPHDIHGRAHERVHVPNNGAIGIHNGLKRTLDEQLSSNISRAEYDRMYLEKLHDHWRRYEKERITASPEERLTSEKERLLHGAIRPPFLGGDQRSPLHIPAFLSRGPGIPNGRGGSGHHLESSHQLYPHLRRVTPYPDKYPHS